MIGDHATYVRGLHSRSRSQHGRHVLSNVQHRSHVLSNVQYRSHVLSDVQHRSHVLSNVQHRSHVLSDVQHRSHVLSDVQHGINNRIVKWHHPPLREIDLDVASWFFLLFTSVLLSGTQRVANSPDRLQ
jgi:hypothetical protein